MAPSRPTTAILAALFSIIRLASAEYNPNEHFVMYDCGIGTDPAHPEWATSYFAEYFSGEVWTDASETQMKPTEGIGAKLTWDGSYPWRESGVSFTMGNEDKVSLTIHPNVNDPNRAGLLTHSYDPNPLTCWSYHWKFGTCQTTYVCNHKDGPHPAKRDKIAIKVSTNKDFAKLVGNINPSDVFSKIEAGANGSCDETQNDIPGGCTIKTKCSSVSARPGLTNSMVETLRRMPENMPEMVKHEKINERYWDPCKSGRDTCIGGYVDNYVDYTWVPLSLSIDVDGNDGNNWVGHLGYEISCENSPQCDVCNGLGFGAGFASFVAGIFAPGLGIALEAVSQGVSGACAANGC